MFRRIVNSVTTRVLAVCWVVGFFVFFLPAHRRGAVKLPGAESVTQADGEAKPYCPMCVAIPEGTDERDRPPADSPIGCAICFLKASLDLPAPVILAPEFVDELRYLLACVEQPAAPSVERQYTLNGRAPPIQSPA